MSFKLIARQQCPNLRLRRDQSQEDFKNGWPGLAVVEGLPGPRLIYHSPDGYNWGYGGSGPADLALNILNYCLPVGCDGQPPERLFDGECSPVAFVLHQDFKRVFLAGMETEGGYIQGEAVDAWIDVQLQEYAARHKDEPEMWFSDSAPSTE